MKSPSLARPLPLSPVSPSLPLSLSRSSITASRSPRSIDSRQEKGGGTPPSPSRKLLAGLEQHADLFAVSARLVPDPRPDLLLLRVGHHVGRVDRGLGLHEAARLVLGLGLDGLGLFVDVVLLSRRREILSKVWRVRKARVGKGEQKKGKEKKRKLQNSTSLPPYLDVHPLDHHLPRLEQHLGYHADLALVRPGDDLHGVARLDVHRLEHGLAVGRQRRRLPLFAGALRRDIGFGFGFRFFGGIVSLRERERKRKMCCLSTERQRARCAGGSRASRERGRKTRPGRFCFRRLCFV